jgi:HSP20 family protein
MANLIRRKEHGAMEPLRRFDPFEVMRELMEWEPFAELRGPAFGGGAFVPTFDVKETKDAYLFTADMPGVKESDLEISLTGNRLTVAGKRQEEKKEEEERYFAYERSYGSFSRSFTLPEGVDPEHVAAELKEGVLRLTLPKKPELQPKKIELKTIEAGKGEKAKA